MSLNDFDAGRWGTLSHKRIAITTGSLSYTLLDAIATKRIKITRFMLSGDTQITYHLLSGIIPLFDFYGSVHFGCDEQASDAGIPVFITNLSDALILNCSAAATANIYLQYRYGAL